MKSLEAVLSKREELKVELEHLEDALKKMRSSGWIDLSEEDKKEYNRLFTCVSKLRIQIDALTYVINYDSVLLDVTPKEAD